MVEVKTCEKCGHPEHDPFCCQGRKTLYIERTCFGPGQGIRRATIACPCTKAKELVNEVVFAAEGSPNLDPRRDILRVGEEKG